MRQFLSFQNLSFRACLFTARVTIPSTSIAWRERLKGIHPFLISVEDRANISQLPQFRFAPRFSQYSHFLPSIQVTSDLCVQLSQGNFQSFRIPYCIYIS